MDADGESTATTAPVMMKTAVPILMCVRPFTIRNGASLDQFSFFIQMLRTETLVIASISIPI